MPTSKGEKAMSTFKLDTVERVVRTTIQAAAGAILLYLTGIIGDGGWDAINWNVCWKAGAAAGVLSLLTAVAGKNAGTSTDNGSFL
jgi:Putative lactococcus lactis phage r1t holin